MRARRPRSQVIALVVLSFATLQGETSTPASPSRFTPPPLVVPANGSRQLEIISPTILELTTIVAGPRSPPPDGPMSPPPLPAIATSDFSVTVEGTKRDVSAIGFRRRPVYAPNKQRDLRIGNFIYLQLAAPLEDGQTLELSYTGKVPWLANARLSAKCDPCRVGAAIHVNQVGYAPEGPKTAFVGYFLGSLQELPPPSPGEFQIVNVRTGEVAHRGTLTSRADRNAPHPWYRKVVEADFAALRTPGEYRLVVPGHGASFPFLIHEGIPAAFARTYALGIYHQRCGGANELPFTRFVHAACHTAPVEVPTRPVTALKGFDEAEAGADIYPFVRQGSFDARGGHHDAGDYSKYAINSAGFIHLLVFAADSLAGVGALDNLGLPESGDGIGDVLQLAKWEADFLAKLQDDDGAFYFLVYPRDRRYEDDVLPERGDPQIFWPKNSAATAAAVAALAQCASSPKMREHFPDAAKHYLEVARRGWKFLMDAEQRLGRGHTYRKFTHYGELFGDADELAWAACELFLATGEREFEREFLTRFDPRSPDTRRWGWRRLSEAYGNAIRSYAFAVRSGRIDPAKLDRTMLARCEAEIITCAEEWTKAARDSAYGLSYPEPTKRVAGGGWFFSADQAFDLAVAAQLDFPEKADRRPAFRDTVISNFNYDAGANPVNVCFITGLGWKRPLEIVHHYAQNDRRVVPPSGIPLASVQEGFTWLWNYKGELGAQCYPLDGAKQSPYPILDRWGDTFNLQTEFVILNQARGLAAAAWLMAQSPSRDQKWRASAGEIRSVPATAHVGQSFTVRLHALDLELDLSDARVVWEGRDQSSVFAREFGFTPQHAGPQWIEAEAQLPDGRRVFAVAEFSAK